ncbi:MAG: DUF87 domain-containing protein, partial [archaeon]
MAGVVKREKVIESTDIFDEADGKERKDVSIEEIEEPEEKEIIQEETIVLKEEKEAKKKTVLKEEKKKSILKEEKEEKKKAKKKDKKNKRKLKITELEPELEVDSDLNEMFESLADSVKELKEEPLEKSLKNEVKDNSISAYARNKIIEQEEIKPILKFLTDEKTNNVFIGRKKSVYHKYGNQASLFIGKIQEEQSKHTKVLMDGLTPHVVFVCGARGSGKSYVLGVIAEELSLNNKNVGIIVVDPVGVFWSMKYPNKEEKEVSLLGDWDLMPQGLKNLRVFIPAGMKSETPKETFDKTFSIQPSLLTSEDWCLTFGIDRFSPTGLLLEKGLRKVRQGYKTVDDGKYVKAKEENYSIEDVINCLETDNELNSGTRGFKQDSIRALVSRFDAAQSWGVFDAKGTPLSQLSREGQLTVIDTSFLDDNVTALVIGIIARRVLAARKISTRKEAAKKIQTSDVDNILEMEIPPTWLFIDEAHTLIPGGNVTTPASHAIIEYVKQGRRPGCSLVFATQQPSAIDSRVLSQLDIILTHKLVFDDDIKAITKRTPAIIPAIYRRPNFVKTLPIGTTLTGDRSDETSRAFVMGVRPRMSQHEGREAETVEMESGLTQEQLTSMTVDLINKKLEKEEEIDTEKISDLVETLNAKYKGITMLSDVLDGLEKKGAVIGPNTVMVKGKKQEEHLAEELEEEIDKEEDSEGIDEKLEGLSESETISSEGLIPVKEMSKIKSQAQVLVETGIDTSKGFLCLPINVKEFKAIQLINNLKSNKLFGLIKGKEEIKDLELQYIPVYKVSYNHFKSKTEFVEKTCFIDSQTNEFLHYKRDKLIESRGLNVLNELSKEEIEVLDSFEGTRQSIQGVMKKLKVSESKARRALDDLTEKGFLEKEKEGIKNYYGKIKGLDLPRNPTHKLLESVNELGYTKITGAKTLKEKFGEKKVKESLQRLWPNIEITEINKVFMPVWSATVVGETNKEVMVSAITGQR